VAKADALGRFWGCRRPPQTYARRHRGRGVAWRARVVTGGDSAGGSSASYDGDGVDTAVSKLASFFVRGLKPASLAIR